ncbi:MAG: TetR/AcrR family transcriptional regulator C-terminal domain-containing protein [Clostridia bacterium]|nr:TetR/AcrR family transcriptional regulator C-terminal domain-containing protein [Clostridia bacterium]
MAKAEYRSSIRSKSLIKKAVAKLIHQKEINKITVSDVIREADISRGTFYAHYPDIQSVFEQIETEEVKKLVNLVNRTKDSNSDIKDTEAFLSIICNHIYDDFDYYKMLMHSSFLNNYLCRIIDIYYEETFATLMSMGKSNDEAKVNIYLTYVTSGAKETIISWLEGRIISTPDLIASRIAKLIELSNEFIK